jgi:hypothetical protein
MKCQNEKSKKVKGATKRKIFNLTDSSESNSSGEGEIIAQLKEKVGANFANMRRSLSRYSSLEDKTTEFQGKYSHDMKEE